VPEEMMKGIKLMLPIKALNNSARRRTLAPVIYSFAQLHSAIAQLVYVRNHHHPVLHRDAETAMIQRLRER